VVALRHAAADLQIEQTFADAVAPHGLLQHERQGRPAHRHIDAQFT
jgi:hypothetical protein